MKTLILTITAITLILGTANYSKKTNPSVAKTPVIETTVLHDFNFIEENYIDDIPFNTETVIENDVFEKAFTKEFDFEEEKYIDDIPFNTNKLVQNSNLFMMFQ